jgi:xanthine permease XanP
LRKPADMTYGLNSRPPPQVLLMGAAQLVGVNTPYLLFLVVLAKATSDTPEQIAQLIRTLLMVLSVACVLQQRRRGAFGSGFPVIPAPNSIYLLPSLIAARAGGMPLVAGMTFVSPAIEIVMSRVIGAMQAAFPPEIAGLILTISALGLGTDGLYTLIGSDGLSVEMMIGCFTYALMVGLTVWGGASLRLFAPLIGIVAGYALIAAFGNDPTAGQAVARAAWFGVPSAHWPDLAFSWNQLPLFAITTIAVVLIEMADLTTFQKLVDKDWVRPDFETIKGGVLANGATNLAAGVLGLMGGTPTSASVGAAAASGVASRTMGLAVAVAYLGMAFMPKLTTVLVATPQPVLAAAIVYTASFILVNGLQIVTSRLLDARRAILIGATMFASVLTISHRLPLDQLPERERALVESPLVLSTLVALALNLLFRIGARRAVRLAVALDAVPVADVEDFLDRAGAQWGARPDMIARARFAAVQVVETISEHATGQAVLTASFDEYTLQLEVAYTGDVLPLPDRRPDPRAIIEDPDATRQLAGWLLRRNADRVLSATARGRQTLTFVFDH